MTGEYRVNIQKDGKVSIENSANLKEELYKRLIEEVEKSNLDMFEIVGILDMVKLDFLKSIDKEIEESEFSE